MTASPTVIAAATLFLSLARASAAEPDRYGRFFERVRPLLVAQCVQCHGPDKAKGGLRLDSADGLRAGGESGPAVVPGDPDRSLLVQAVGGNRPEHPDWRMPPKQRLAEKQVAELAAWVRDGAVWPEPAQELLRGDPATVEALPPGDGGGEARLAENGKHPALAVRGQRQRERMPGWGFRVRENPGPGEYRYIRFRWKKVGGGAAYMELANGGAWRQQPGQRNAAWVAGPNSSGWEAHAVGERAPAEWTTVTRDLWADRGDWNDFTVTGVSVTSVGGGEVLVDYAILGRTAEDLDGYAPGRGRPAFRAKPLSRRVGDAWTDRDNPAARTFHGERLDLWSLKKAVRPGEPRVARADWVRNPVDRFVLAALEAGGLQPSGEADRRTLIRRVTFDLTGLPPTPEEVEAFLRDPAPDAYEKLVDRLLTSPRYGERSGRLWLDVVRYADSNGFERDEFRPDMWRYRDYVIRSLNGDKPFDQFVREQLAGDEMADAAVRSADDADRWVATGYLRLGPFDSTGPIFEEDKRGRDELMSDLVNTTGSAFLGLTMACCQCHDHKYDPLPQADHYRMRAFFAAVRPRDDFPIDTGASADAIRRHNEQIDRAVEERSRQRAAILAPARERLAAERRSRLPDDVRALLRDGKGHDEATEKKLKRARETVAVKDEEALAALPAADRERCELLRKEAERLQAAKRSGTRAVVMTDAGRSAPATHVFFQGDFTQPRDEVPPGIPSVFDPNPAPPAPVPTATTGRRTALARWVASPENPLTARVIVNRLWQQHFGKGIVATPNDFGFSGARPTHPELLDWLATELTGRGWSLKHVHRLLVTSAAYRQASFDDRARRKLDPDNRLLWRQNVRRLDAETLRDALLAVSGKLLPDAGGPPRWPEVPEDLLKCQPGILEALEGHDGGRRQGWYASPPEAVDVRSIYLIQKRVLPIPFLQPFDVPDTAVSCGCRQVTTVAPQALTLLNSPEAARLARAFARRLESAAADPARQVEAGFRLALARAPDDDERALSLELLRRHAERYRAAGADGAAAAGRALADLCRALLNLNEFLYID